MDSINGITGLYFESCIKFFVICENAYVADFFYFFFDFIVVLWASVVSYFLILEKKQNVLQVMWVFPIAFGYIFHCN
jgi:hypothetical protein